jgi:hypothetical protein
MAVTRVGFGHPFGADDQRIDFTPNRVAIEKLAGTSAEND